MTIPTKLPDADVIERVIIQGDLSKLSPQDRTIYYHKVCESLGLNPLTTPFEYIVLNGKLRLYAKRDCADQLRRLHGITIEIVSQDWHDGLYTVHVRAKDAAGRGDEDLGVVSIPENVKGEARANSVMKAITKAKRRVTLSLSGLGWLDENEVGDIPGARRPPQASPNVMRAVEPPHDSETGEVLDESESSPSAPQAVGDPQPIAGAMGAAEAPASRSASDAGATSDVNKLDAWLASEALQGSEALDKAWDRLTTDKRWEALTVKQRQGLEKAFYRRHQVTAADADAEIANDLAARE